MKPTIIDSVRKSILDLNKETFFFADLPNIIGLSSKIHSLIRKGELELAKQHKRGEQIVNEYKIIGLVMKEQGSRPLDIDPRSKGSTSVRCAWENVYPEFFSVPACLAERTKSSRIHHSK